MKNEKQINIIMVLTSLAITIAMLAMFVKMVKLVFDIIENPYLGDATAFAGIILAVWFLAVSFGFARCVLNMFRFYLIRSMRSGKWR